MKCNQARDMLLDRLDKEARLESTPDLDLHLRECAACQTWYKQQQLAAAALEQLEPYPVPEAFTARVLAHLPARKTSDQPARQARGSRVPTSLRQVWRDLVASLSSPVGRRRLVPALLTVAAALVIAVGLFATLQGDKIPVTPGAATGSSGWLIFAGSLVAVGLAVVGWLLLRRK